MRMKGGSRSAVNVSNVNVPCLLVFCFFVAGCWYALLFSRGSMLLTPYLFLFEAGCWRSTGSSWRHDGRELKTFLSAVLRGCNCVWGCGGGRPSTQLHAYYGVNIFTSRST